VSTPNADMVGEACAAINRRDAHWLSEHSHPDVELRMTGVAGEPVLYTGAAGIREWVRDLAEIWESMEVIPEEIRDLGDRVFVIVTVKLRGRASGVDVETKGAMVCDLRDGKATQIRSYTDVGAALADAELEP
jgi:ketosteroid isomerase-like protein